MFNFKSKSKSLPRHATLHGNYKQVDDDGGQSQVSENSGPERHNTSAGASGTEKASKSSPFSKSSISKKLHNFGDLFRKKPEFPSSTSKELPGSQHAGGFSQEQVGNIMNEDQAEGTSMAMATLRAENMERIQTHSLYPFPKTNEETDDGVLTTEHLDNLLKKVESLWLVVTGLDSFPGRKEVEDLDANKNLKLIKMCSLIVEELESKWLSAAYSPLVDKDKLSKLEDTARYLKEEFSSRTERKVANVDDEVKVETKLIGLELEVEFELAKMNEKSEQQELPFRNIRNFLGTESSVVIEEMRDSDGAASTEQKKDVAGDLGTLL